MASFSDRAWPTMSCDVKRRPAPADMASNAALREASRVLEARRALAERAP